MLWSSECLATLLDVLDVVGRRLAAAAVVAVAAALLRLWVTVATLSVEQKSYTHAAVIPDSGAAAGGGGSSSGGGSGGGGGGGGGGRVLNVDLPDTAKGKQVCAASATVATDPRMCAAASMASE